MIKQIQTSDNYVVTSSYSPQWIGNNGPLAGQMRLNTMSQTVEVFDGIGWYSYSSTPTVGLSYDTQMVINWAKTKMAEEALLKEKMEKHPTLKAAYEQYKMVEALVYEEAINEKS